MGYHCVNKSGSVVNVRNYNMDTIIGKLYPNETFVLTDGFYMYMNNQIKFMNSSGQFVTGYLADGYTLEDAGVINVATPQYTLPVGTININGNECSMLKVMRDTGLYNSSGTRIGTVYAGEYVATIGGICGQNYPYLMAISGYRSTGATDGGWTYGAFFVDTGIKVSSTNPSIRGNW